MEAQADTTSIALGLAVISLLGALGVIAFFIWGGLNIPGKTMEQSAVLGMILSAILFVAMLVGLVLAGRRGDKQGKRISAIIIGALSIPFLLCAGGLSWLIYATAGCTFK
jgi:hypothetical protein